MRRIAIDVGVVVADLDRSLHFYRDLLDLSVIAELTTSLIGTGRMVQLQHGQSLIKLVELNERPLEQSPIGIPTTLGYRYITLLVADLTAIMTKMAQAHVTITLPVTQLQHGTTIAMVSDPDGNIVEFVQEGVGLDSGDR